jgi:UDP-N-acetylglucosamine acyltransferase
MNNLKNLDNIDVQKILPHRFPFLLVDKIIELDIGKRAVGLKNVTINEDFFNGHFPGQPVMPGVLIVEAMAQVGGVALLSMPQCIGKLAYFAAIESLRIRRPVLPGDQLIMEAIITKTKGRMGKISVKSTVEGMVVAEGEYMFSLVEKTDEVNIHTTTQVDSTAQLGKGVNVGPYCIIGKEVIIGDNTRIDAHAVIDRWTTIGKNCHIHYGAVIGDIGQDIKFKGERSFVEVGDGNQIREYVTIHRATGEDAKTVLGNGNIIMANSHVAHNCKIGNNVSIASYTGLSGHVVIEDNANVGGMVGIHQFVRIGELAMVGGYSRVAQDIPPYMLVEGSPAKMRGINSIGLARKGVSAAAQTAIKKAFKLLFRSKLNTSQAVKKIKESIKHYTEIDHLISFLEASDRGIPKRQVLEGD